MECRHFSSIEDLNVVLAQVNIPNAADQHVMIWLESPSNPTMKVFDIRSVTNAANQFGATVVADNRFLTGALQRPLVLGAHVVMAYVSKALAGHSDVIMGVTVCKDMDIGAKLRRAQISDGASPSPFDCFLALRGMRTLALRIGRLIMEKWLHRHLHDPRESVLCCTLVWNHIQGMKLHDHRQMNSEEWCRSMYVVGSQLHYRL